MDRLSLLSAEYRAAGHQVIVTDGGSADDTRRRALAMADQVVESQPGRAIQMNAGADRADGDVLLFLHADTELPGDADRLVCNALRGSGRAWGRFDVRLSGAAWAFRVIEKAMNLRSCVTGICTGDQAIFVRHEAFVRVGGFPSQALMEDVALSARLKRVGPPVCLRARVVTSSRRWESDGILRTILLMWGLRLAYFFGASPERLARVYYRRPPGSDD